MVVVLQQSVAATNVSNVAIVVAIR